MRSTESAGAVFQEVPNGSRAAPLRCRSTESEEQVDVQDKTNRTALDADAVAEYLKRNPTFFTQRDDLVAELEIAHPAGGAVSLLERQVSILRDRNMEMRHRLTGLLDNARDNDKLFDQTKRLVLRLLEASTLDQIVETFNQGLRQDFGVEFAALIPFGAPSGHRNARCRIVTAGDARAHIEALLSNNRAVCGVLRPEEVRFLFPEQHARVGSAAVVPLNGSFPLGVLAIASPDAGYFRSSMGTLFLGYIAEVLERLLPRHLKPAA